MTLSTAEHPIDRLVALAARRATGELVSISPTGETHLYLQQGRIAWGIDSRCPQSFAGQLQITAGIADEMLREVVDECRRGRLSLTATLVEWGLTSVEDLRRALRVHLRDTLATLAHDDGGESFFLARTWPPDDATFTFDLVDLELDTSAPQGHASTRASLAARVRARVDGLAWAEELEGDRLVDADPPTTMPRTPKDLVGATLLDGAEFAAAHASDASLFGIATHGERSLWCRVSERSTLGGALSAIATIDGVLDRRPHAPRPRPATPTWVAGDPELLATLREFCARGHEVLGAIVLHDGLEMRAGLGYDALVPDDCLALVRRRCVALQGATARSIGMRRMVTGESSVWCFGAALEHSDSLTLWLTVDRSATQGLGWTYLATLANALTHRTRELE